MWNISKNSFNVKFIADIIFIITISSFLSISSSSLHSEVSWIVAVSVFSRSALYFLFFYFPCLFTTLIIFLLFKFIFNWRIIGPQHCVGFCHLCSVKISFPEIHFYFFALLSSFLVNFLFWLSIFVKTHMGLSLEYKKSTKLHTLLFLCKLNEMLLFNSDQSPTGFERSHITDHDVHLLFTLLFVIWETSRGFYNLWNSQSTCWVI